jgi:hypothetical protein
VTRMFVLIESHGNSKSVVLSLVSKCFESKNVHVLHVWKLIVITRGH